MSARRTYTVMPGDTLVEIAWAFDVPSGNITSADEKALDPWSLYPGQHLIILERSRFVSTSHIVIPGETKKIILQQHKISEDYLDELNQSIDWSNLSRGQVLRLPTEEEYFHRRQIIHDQIIDIIAECGNDKCSLASKMDRMKEMFASI